MSSRYEWIFLFSDKDEASRAIPYASWAWEVFKRLSRQSTKK